MKPNAAELSFIVY